MNFIPSEIEEYAREVTQPEPELLQELTQVTHQETTAPQMLTGRLEGRFLKLLVMLSQAKSILEIGMFTGYSALSMAEGLPDDGQLITCEVDPRVEKIAQSYFAKSPHGHKISIRMGPALETIKKLETPLDLVFIDADKANYSAYYEAVLPKLKKGGLIVIDNALWSGRVLDPKEQSDRAINDLNRLIARDWRVENVMLTLRDGVHLVRKC